MIGVGLLNFPSQWIFLFKLEILFHKYLCQIDDFTMHLWHLKRVYFVYVHKDAKSEPLKLACMLYTYEFGRN
jgi:hypothetical protein